MTIFTAIYYKMYPHSVKISLLLNVIITGILSTCIISCGRDIQSIDSESEIYLFADAANKYIVQFDLDQARLYLDSASMCLENVNNPLLLGFYYQVAGDYYNHKRNDSIAHFNYYKAMVYYEKSGQENLLSSIYYNLALSYIQKADLYMIRQFIKKLQFLVLKQKDEMAKIAYYEIQALYYDCLYKKDNSQLMYIDSIILYNSKIISIFNTNAEIQDQKADIGFNYIMLAENLIKKEGYNRDSVVHFLDKAKAWSHPDDTSMIINSYWVKGEIAYDLKDLIKAKGLYEYQLGLMENWSGNENLSLYIETCDRLSDILEKEGDFKAALHYERKKYKYSVRIHDAQKYEQISDLKEKYETEKKDQEILFQKKIKWLYLGICIFSVLSLFFIVRWLLSRKKNIEVQLQLVKKEKNEAKLYAKLKEEQFKKVELEKYEALLDSHFKKTEILGKNKVLMELKSEQEELNQKIKDYITRLQKYENDKQQNLAADIIDPYFYNIANEVYHLIRRRLNNKDYIEDLNKLNDNFFINLKTQHEGDISVVNMKYCICFAIDMETSDIVTCFCVEPRSIHMVRHRLRKKLNIDNKIDLNIFLKQLIWL